MGISKYPRITTFTHKTIANSHVSSLPVTPSIMYIKAEGLRESSETLANAMRFGFKYLYSTLLSPRTLPTEWTCSSKRLEAKRKIWQN